jgi:hypothetical protein
MSSPNMPSEISMLLTAAEVRLIRAHRNTDDEVQDTTVRMIENYALNPALMRKVPVFQLIAGSNAAAPAKDRPARSVAKLRVVPTTASPVRSRRRK